MLLRLPRHVDSIDASTQTVQDASDRFSRQISMWTLSLSLGACAIALLSTLASVAAGGLRAPPTPVWAATWQAPFDEYAGILSFGNTSGYFWYDYDNGFARTDRDNVGTMS